MLFRLLLIWLVTIVPIAAVAEPFTSQQGDEILQELRQIRKLLEDQQTRPNPAPYVNARPMPGIQQARQASPTSNPPADQPVKWNITGAPSMGQSDAPLVLALYTDYECPFCRRFETETFPAINKNFIATGKLRYVVIDAPLDIHVNAKKAAEATRCAGEQDQYWNYRNRLSSVNEALDTNQLISFARESGLNVVKFEGCLRDGKYSKIVLEAAAESRRQGVTGTPTFVLGTEKNGILEGVRIMGAQPYAVFEQKFNDLLNKK